MNNKVNVDKPHQTKILFRGQDSNLGCRGHNAKGTDSEISLISMASGSEFKENYCYWTEKFSA